ncbi:hypothetical protein ES703_43868 [subsurface metagenome]
MDKGDNVKPRVTPSAQARVEIAKEKARITGKKPAAAPSELEQTAERWAEKWKEGREFQPAQPLEESGDSPVSIASVPLLTVMDKSRRDEEIIWKQHRLHPEERPRQIKMNSAMINSIAQHLRAREWARAMGKTRRQSNDGYNLEKAAEQWKRQKEFEQRGFPGTNQRSALR